jgi:hypothetical protein
MWTEIDEELFPSRKALVGLQFATPEDFERAKQLIAEELSFYRELYPYWCMIVVQRDAADRFCQAGFQFSEIEQVDEEDLRPEDVAEFYRGLIAAWQPVLRERLRHTR